MTAVAATVGFAGQGLTMVQTPTAADGLLSHVDGLNGLFGHVFFDTFFAGVSSSDGLIDLLVLLIDFLGIFGQGGSFAVHLIDSGGVGGNFVQHAFNGLQRQFGIVRHDISAHGFLGYATLEKVRHFILPK